MLSDFGLYISQSVIIWPDADGDVIWLKKDSHSHQPGHHGATAIKHVAIDYVEEVDEEGCDGEDQRELLILTAAV